MLTKSQMILSSGFVNRGYYIQDKDRLKEKIDYDEMRRSGYMDCREKRRKLIAKEYDIAPIIHAKLLNGQTKYGDAASPITGQYYIFECIHKVTGKLVGIQFYPLQSP